MTAEDRVTAAELALGLLDAAEHATASARATTDPSFAREVEWWQQQFAPLFDQVGEVPPPPSVRERIEARLDVPVLGERRGPRRWRLVGIGGALGALAASVVAWMLPPTRTPPPPPPPVVVPAQLLAASLSPTQDPTKQAIVALIDRDTASVRLSMPIDVPRDRSGQLWRIPAGGKPVSLGVLPSAAARSLALRGSSLPAVGDQVAVSVEPVGGSPTGQPTGPVILAGVVSTV